MKKYLLILIGVAFMASCTKENEETINEAEWDTCKLPWHNVT